MPGRWHAASPSISATFARLLIGPPTAETGAVVNFTRTLAGEWAPHGIRVNGIAPTYLVTALTEKLLSDPVPSAKIRARTPMGKVGVPEDLAGAMLYLASPASSLVTGHILAVDGGWLAW